MLVTIPFLTEKRALLSPRALAVLLTPFMCAAALASSPASHGADVQGDFQELAEEYLELPDAKKSRALFNEMRELASEHRECRRLLQTTLEAGWTKSVEILSSPAIEKKFKPLRKARADLDAMRAAVIGLVHDKERYPYPFALPDATPAQYEAYAQAQLVVEKSIGEIETAWKKSPKVRLPDAVHDAFTTLALTLDFAAELNEEYLFDFDFTLRGTPAWALGLPFPGDVRKDIVTLASLGLNYEEGRMIAESRAVMELNEAYCEEYTKAEKDRRKRKLLQATFDQVAVTNRYRQLLGLRALAWDRRLQVACDQHANYIVESGDFGHFQADPKFKDFMDRAEQAGYSRMVYENCQRGTNHPEAAHKALMRSTEHHRNMTRADVFEMATGNSKRIWVQNFGRETGFRKHIKLSRWWSDKAVAENASKVR